MEIVIAAATFGLVLARASGGPIAQIFTRRFGVPCPELRPVDPEAVLEQRETVGSRTDMSGVFFGIAGHQSVHYQRQVPERCHCLSWSQAASFCVLSSGGHPVIQSAACLSVLTGSVPLAPPITGVGSDR